MYMHTFTCVCESQRCFSLLLSLKYITYFFSVCPLCCLPSLLHSPGARPSVFLPSCLPSACPPLLLSVVCSVAAVCLLLCPRGSFRVPVFCVCALEAPRRPSVCPAVCRAACRHSSAVRRKTVWQCGQMHRVYVPGLISSSCLCAAVACSVARPAACRPSVCVSCCRVSSGGSNRRYASISRAAAMRCSVWSVMLLLSICIRTFCRVSPIRLDSSTTPTPAAFMCSLI